MQRPTTFLEHCRRGGGAQYFSLMRCTWRPVIPIIFLTHTAIYCLAVKRVYDIRSTKVSSDRIENCVSERMMGYLLFHIRI
jgi:hypothetical protein